MRGQAEVSRHAGCSGLSATALSQRSCSPSSRRVFDFGGDVGVGLLDPVAQDVAEPAGLGDLGDAVGDHPGLVAVAQPVEGQPGFDRRQPHHRLGPVEGAVDGRAQGAAAEVAAPVQLAASGMTNTNRWSCVARCARSRSTRNGGRVMVRADSAVLGGPSSIPRLDSMQRPDVRVDDDDSRRPASVSRWVLWRCSPASSPQRAPVQAAVTIRIAAVGSAAGSRAALSAIGQHLGRGGPDAFGCGVRCGGGRGGGRGSGWPG